MDAFRKALGTPKAITAAAHKLARIVYHLVTTRQEFDATIFEALERRSRDHKHLRLRAPARELGFDLVKINPEAAS
jgi:transposase